MRAQLSLPGVGGAGGAVAASPRVMVHVAVWPAAGGRLTYTLTVAEARRWVPAWRRDGARVLCVSREVFDEIERGVV